jgi:hypothetical protein
MFEVDSLVSDQLHGFGGAPLHPATHPKTMSTFVDQKDGGGCDCIQIDCLDSQIRVLCHIFHFQIELVLDFPPLPISFEPPKPHGDYPG